MNHPPIPPNSKRFKTIDGKSFFRHCGHCGQFWNIDLLRGEDQDDCRNAARCYWLDEALKWATLPVNDCKNFADIARWKAEAEADAEAWRIWGNEK